MVTLLGFLDRIAPGLYLFVVALCLWNIWRVRTARVELRATYYELERDLARLKQVNALTIIVIAAQVALLVMGIQQSLLPYLQQEERLRNVAAEQNVLEDGVFVTSTPPPIVASGLDIQPVEIGGDENPGLQLTPTYTPIPVGTIIPNAPPIQGCGDPRATLKVPANGMRVFQPTTVIGTAYTDNFTSAKIEISGPGTNNTYAVIGETLLPVRDTADFSQFSPAQYIAGIYQFRLMVFDISGSPVASCMVNIYISEPPVTPTPSPTPAVTATPNPTTSG
jgi:hypothetical protein